MSGDEVFVLVASLVAGPAMWSVWWSRILAVQSLRTRRRFILPLFLVQMFDAALLAVVLKTLSAPDVRHDTAYGTLYFVMGLAWMRMGEAAFAFAGISAHDDVVERRNAAGAPAVVGAMFGVTCCFAGGNIGAGPGWPVVVFSAALATAALMVMWLAVDWLTFAADAITIDRDLATGMRIGGLLASGGLIFGRAVSGNWHSAESTLRDLVQVGWVIVPLTAVAVGVERRLRPASKGRRSVIAGGGVMHAIVYPTIALAYLMVLGRPL